jgi:hypothetical protein
VLPVDGLNPPEDAAIEAPNEGVKPPDEGALEAFVPFDTPNEGVNPLEVDVLGASALLDAPKEGVKPAAGTVVFSGVDAFSLVCSGAELLLPIALAKMFDVADVGGVNFTLDDG